MQLVESLREKTCITEEILPQSTQLYSSMNFQTDFFLYTLWTQYFNTNSYSNFHPTPCPLEFRHVNAHNILINTYISCWFLWQLDRMAGWKLKEVSRMLNLFLFEPLNSWLLKPPTGWIRPSTLIRKIDIKSTAYIC